MAALPDNGGPRMRSEPLGSLLTNRGHITEEQLELALTEQKATGRPLGEIIVARGFAPGPTVAQALATQHGGLLKTEYGFATGWGGQENSVARVAAAEPPRTDETASLRASLAEHQKALEAWKQSHAKLEERVAELQQAAPAADGSQLAELEAVKGERDALKVELAEAHKASEPVEDPRVAQLEAELAEARRPVETVEDPRVAQLEAELAEARRPVETVEDPRVAQLEAELAEARRPVETVEDPRIAQLEAERDALRSQLAEAQTSVESVEDPRLEELAARCEGLQAQLAAGTAAFEELERKLAELEAGRTDLEHALAREVERGETARLELADRQAAPAPAGRWDAAESHLVFFQGSDGYEMHERKGPPPAEGSQVGKQIVARIASAPIPGSKLPCAYLVA